MKIVWQFCSQGICADGQPCVRMAMIKIGQSK